MATLFEGDCKGRVVDAEFGLDNQNKPRVRWNMLVTEGPHEGKKASYSGKLDPDNIKWTKLAMIAIGWQGKDVNTFVADVAKANKVVQFTAEIASYERDGKTSTWTSAKNIGFQAQPLRPLGRDKTADVNQWFAEVNVEGQQQQGEETDVPF